MKDILSVMSAQARNSRNANFIVLLGEHELEQYNSEVEKPLKEGISYLASEVNSKTIFKQLYYEGKMFHILSMPLTSFFYCCEFFPELIQIEEASTGAIENA